MVRALLNHSARVAIYFYEYYYSTVKCLMLDYAQFATRMNDEIIVAKLGRFVVQRHFQLKGK